MVKILVTLIAALFATQIKAETLVIEKSNSLTIRGEVNAQSMAKASSDLYKLNRSLEKGKPIFVVLDTPGGSIDAGLDFLRFAKSLERPIHTVTMRAASMGFVIAQTLDDRFILEDGTLMMHRASVQINGQVPGEVSNRVEYIKEYIEHLEIKMAKRLGIQLKEYKDMVHDEFYIFGQKAVDRKVADKVVTLKCGTSLAGTTKQKVQVFIFQFELEFSDCPLMTTPIVSEPKDKEAAKMNNSEFLKALDIIKKQYFTKPVLPEVKFYEEQDNSYNY